MKLTKQDLDILFSMAKQAYVDSDQGDLDSQQFQAACWVKALACKLNLNIELPIKAFPDPED